MERSLIFKAFADNPIVLRDLRATMRGTRSYWFQGIYLLLLGVLAVTGYAVATGQNLLPHSGQDLSQFSNRVFSMVDAQSRLQQFYYFIFVTLAGLITLIAPALTATSVTDERQRQSLDLLITTPISAFEMLVGKLISSLAFLGLLLVLSLPASALCVLLGGATIGDMFRIYVMLAVDAVVLASIGLYFSCAVKNSLQAVIWTYASVILFTFLTYVSAEAGVNGNQGLQSVTDVRLSMAISALSPFTVFTPAAGQSILMGPIAVPVWLAMIPVAFLAVRLLLTSATYRFGVFGSEAAVSLRKQVLGLTGLLAFVYGISLAHKSSFLVNALMNPADHMNESYNGVWQISSLYIILLAAALPFLPGLFVPVKAEDAPPGETQANQSEREQGWFRIGTALLPRHSGALPYYLQWVGISLIGGFLGMTVGVGRIYSELVFPLICAGVYMIGVGTMVWGIARLAARFAPRASNARALAFGMFVLAVALPGLPLTLTQTDWRELPILACWIMGPFIWGNNGYQVISSLVISGVVAAALGAFAGYLGKPRKA